MQKKLTFCHQGRRKEEGREGVADWSERGRAKRGKKEGKVHEQTNKRRMQAPQPIVDAGVVGIVDSTNGKPPSRFRGGEEHVGFVKWAY